MKPFQVIKPLLLYHYYPIVVPLLSLKILDVPGSFFPARMTCAIMAVGGRRGLRWAMDGHGKNAIPGLYIYNIYICIYICIYIYM